MASPSSVSKPAQQFHVFSNNAYADTAIALVAFATLAAMCFVAVHKYDFAKCQERIVKFFSEQLPLRISLVSGVGVLTITIPMANAYRVNYKRPRLKEEMMAQGKEIPDAQRALMGKIAKHNASIFLRGETDLKNELERLGEEAQEEIWKLVGQKIVEDPTVNPRLALEKLARLFPAKEQEGNEEDLFCKENLDAARLYLNSIRIKHPVSFNAQLSSFLLSVAAAIENILNGLGIADFLEPSNSEMQASFKSQKLVTLINIFMVVSSVMIASLGPKAGGGISGAVFGGLSVTSVLWKSIRPLPPSLPGEPENWTQQIRDGKLRPLAVREDILDDMSEALKSNRHVLLLGASRGGKTQTAKAFAQAVEDGKYPHLAGKKVFKWNGSDLANHKPSAFGGGSIVHDIEKAVGKNINDIIIVIDEAHALFQGDSGLGTQFLSLLDEGGPFRHVIAITTDKEYKDVIVPKDPASAFSNRFVPMSIQKTTPEETEAILVHNMRQNSSLPLADDGILMQMAEYGAGNDKLPQPYTSINILKKAIEIVGLDPFKNEGIKKASKTVKSSKTSTTALSHKQKEQVMGEENEEEAATALANRKKLYAELIQQKGLIHQITRAKFEALQKGALLNDPKKKQDIALQIETLEKIESTLIADLKARSTEAKFNLVIDQEVLEEAIKAMEKEAEDRLRAKSQEEPAGVAQPAPVVEEPVNEEQEE